MNEVRNARIVLDGGTEYIECLRCGNRSAFGWDVAKRYCAKCRVFFDVVTLPNGETETLRSANGPARHAAVPQAT